jgi:transposase
MSNRSFTAAEISSKIALFHAFRQDGMRVHEITRRLGVTDTTIYNWLRKYDAASAEKSQLAKLKRENARLRRLVAAMPAVSAVKTSPLSPVPNRH